MNVNSNYRFFICNSTFIYVCFVPLNKHFFIKRFQFMILKSLNCVYILDFNLLILVYDVKLKICLVTFTFLKYQNYILSLFCVSYIKCCYYCIECIMYFGHLYILIIIIFSNKLCWEQKD